MVQLQVDGVNLKYDPKAGFRLWKTLINPSVSVSVFQCKTDLSPKDRVDIAVLPPRGTHLLLNEYYGSQLTPNFCFQKQLRHQPTQC